MSESVRYESAERVRDFYRNQGVVRERNRLVELLEQEYRKMLDAGHKAHTAGLDYAIKVLKGEIK
jgi:hypothetical protein